jgi:hypothetical protein
MVYNTCISGFLDFVHHLVFKETQKNTLFWKLMETHPISKTLCAFVFFRIPNNGHSPKTQ